VHGALITLAILASRAVPAPRVSVPPFVLPPAPTEPGLPPHLEPPQAPTPPSEGIDPTRIPVPPRPDLPPEASIWRRELGPAGQREPDPQALWGAAGDTVPMHLVDQPPELLTATPPAYPESLRRAGIVGRVVVRAVVDTLGRVEPGSDFVVSSDNPGFDGPALVCVRRALFRPARVLGGPVRVLGGGGRGGTKSVLSARGGGIVSPYAMRDAALAFPPCSRRRELPCRATGWGFRLPA